MLGRMGRVALVVLALLGGVLGGVASGYFFVRWRSVPERAPQLASAEPVEVEGLDELDNRLSSLEASVRRLERDRQLATAAQLGNPPAEATSAGRAVRAAVDDPVFDEAVRDVLDRIQSERAKERTTERQERRRQAAQRWSNELGQRLGMTDQQKAKAADLAVEYMNRVQELWSADAGTEPANRSQRREQVQSLRTRYDQQLNEILDGRQQAAYKSLDEDQRLGASGRSRSTTGGQQAPGR